MSRTTLTLSAIVVALLVGVGGVLYAFGTPSAPAPRVASPAAGLPEQGAQDSRAVTSQQAEEPGVGTATQPVAEVPAPDPDSPLAIQIPGCVCHSDDPKLVEEHANYRMNQCAGCHAGVVPTGQ